MKSLGEQSVDEAIALLLASTRRKKRPVSLLAVYNSLKVAIQHFGSISAVAEALGLTSKMLTQFMAVGKINEAILPLIESRLIDSVDAVNQISKLTKGDQALVSLPLSNGDWNTEDIRAFCELRKNAPQEGASVLIEKVSRSKTIPEYAFEITIRGKLNADIIMDRLACCISRADVKAINIAGSKATVVLDGNGFEKIKGMAKSMKEPIASIMPTLIYRNN